MKTAALILSGTIGLAGLILMPLAAQAAPAKCGDRTKLVQILEKKYKEYPVAVGISQQNTEAFEIFTSKTGSWTVMMTLASGKTCIMAAGHSWQDLPKTIADVKT